MSTRNSLFQTLAGVAMMIPLSGCGAGEDPLNLIDPTLDSITVTLPFDITESTANLTGGFSSTTPYFTWTLSGWTLTNQADVHAPAQGLVTDVHEANGVYDVTIRVNSRFSIKVGAMTARGNVREGDLLAQGERIGNTTASVTLTVYEDGTVTCPLPHLNDEARGVLTTLTASQACQ